MQGSLPPSLPSPPLLHSWELASILKIISWQGYASKRWSEEEKRGLSYYFGAWRRLLLLTLFLERCANLNPQGTSWLSRESLFGWLFFTPGPVIQKCRPEMPRRSWQPLQGQPGMEGVGPWPGQERRRC